MIKKAIRLNLEYNNRNSKLIFKKKRYFSLHKNEDILNFYLFLIN